MAYGTVKVDNITFTNGGIDQTVTVSGIVQSISGNITATGTIQGQTIIGTSTVSGATVTGDSGQYGNLNSISGVFTTQISGATVTGNVGSFSTITGGTVTLTSGVFGAGSAANPSISFTGDANSGLYSPGADQVAVAINGTGRLFVDASGNVGINTTSGTPYGMNLAVVGTIGLIPSTFNTVGSSIFIKSQLGASGGEEIIRNEITSFANGSNYGTATIFSTRNGVSVGERLRITSAGLVGVGTSAPNYQLHVTTDFAVGASGFNQQLTFGNDTIQSLLLGTGYTALKLNPLGGNVGIGTTSPGTALHCSSGSVDIATFQRSSAGADAALMVVDGNSTGAYINTAGGANVVFATRSAGTNSERARIDSSGRLLVGTSTARSNFYNSTGVTTPQLQVEGTTYSNSSLCLVNNNASTNGGFPMLVMAKSAGSSVGSNTAVTDGHVLGQITFQGNDGAEFVVGADITAYVDGNPSADDMPSRLVFSTTADGASSPTERMRITSAGLVGIGVTSPSYLLDVAGSARIKTGATGTPFIVSTGGDSQGTLRFGSTGLEYSINSGADYLGMIFNVNGSQRAAIDTSGRLLVGTSTASSTNTLFESSSTTANAANVALVKRNSGTADQAGQQLHFYNFGPAGTGRAADTEVGSMRFYGSQPTSGAAQEMARITCAADLLQTGTNTSGRLTFSTTADGGSSPTERMRIDSSGRLLVGTTSGSNEPRLVVVGNQGNNNGSGWLALGRGEGASTINNNEGLGTISFTDNAQNEFARISADADAAAGAGDYPGRLVFSTTADGASSPTERLRIDSNGYLTALGVYNNTTAVAANVHVSSAGGLLFRSTSSIKYKTDVETIQDSYSEALLDCRPVWYRSTCEGDNADWGWWGFIAEEVAEIDPRLVHWKTTEVTYDENNSPVQTPCEPEPESVQYDRFVPHLLNLIKRQQQAIETLEAKVAALESA